MNTLALSSTWDLTLDGSGNIAVATGASAIAQDVASSARVFKGELWFEPTVGLPYLSDVLGQLPPLSILQEAYNAAALSVPEVASATTTLNPVDVERTLTGTIQVIDNSGEVINTTI